MPAKEFEWHLILTIKVVTNPGIDKPHLSERLLTADYCENIFCTMFLNHNQIILLSKITEGYM